MKLYFKFLSALYFVGAVLHYLDLLDLRLKFSTMDLTWKIWIAALAVADTIAFVGLWRGKLFGEIAFLVVAISQLLAYGIFYEKFGSQTFLVVFHAATLTIYGFLRLRVQSNKGDI